MAMTPSPTPTPPESANDTGWSFDAATSTFRIAISVEASLPTTVALAFEPSAKVTVTVLAPSITCWFVTM